MSKTFEDRVDSLKHTIEAATVVPGDSERRRLVEIVARLLYEYGRIDGAREELEHMKDAAADIFGSGQ